MTDRSRQRWREWALSLPSTVWLTVLFVVPSLILFVIVFKPSDPYGGVGAGWSFETVRTLWPRSYWAIAWRTVWLSLVATALCLLFALPAGCCIAQVGPRWRRTLLLLIIVPFWTSSLVRIFAWRVLLHPEGWIKRALAAGGLAGPDTVLLYTPAAVLLVLVYTYLPFAILPIYAAAEKFDQALVDAARDLGATRFQAFTRVFLPGISRGVLTAALLVFIPALGSYVIPDLVGGPAGQMLGNKIAQRTFVDRNLPQASGLAALLMLAVLAPMAASLFLQRRRHGAAGKEAA